jgi:hypothetical protein
MPTREKASYVSRGGSFFPPHDWQGITGVQRKCAPSLRYASALSKPQLRHRFLHASLQLMDFVKIADDTGTRPSVPTLDRAKMSLPDTPSLSISQCRLLALLRDERGSKEDDYGEISPSQFAFRLAFELVSEAERLARGNVKGHAVVDSEGGIRVTWRGVDESEVRLVCPATSAGNLYIYEQKKRDSTVYDAPFDAALLAEKLKRLRD